MYCQIDPDCTVGCSSSPIILTSNHAKRKPMSKVERLPSHHSTHPNNSLFTLRLAPTPSLVLLTILSSLLTSTVIQAQPPGLDLYPLANVSVDRIPDVPDNIPRQEPGRPRDCAEVQDQAKGAPSGVYTIYPATCAGCYFHVYCDMDTEGGGWTIITRRFNGSVDFYRGWYFYKMGFGDVNGEYFLGLDRIHQLTTQKQMELKVCLTDVGGMMMTAGYSHFYLSNMTENFALHVHSYYGDAGDYLSKSNNRPFSTFDHDLDGSLKNCAAYYHSAWWYHSYGDCTSSTNIFGYYYLGTKHLPTFAGPGLSWSPVPGPGTPALKDLTIKVRPMGYIGGSFVGLESIVIPPQPLFEGRP